MKKVGIKPPTASTSAPLQTNSRISLMRLFLRAKFLASTAEQW